MSIQQYDIVLVGAGIMSATLASLVHELDPSLTIAIYERLDEIALESSAVMNNAGTWHSAFCELNYTPQATDGSVDIGKALEIVQQFELSKQYWSYLVSQWYTDRPQDFIHQTPHCSVVFGEEDVKFLRARWEAMTQSPLFAGMQYSDNPDQIREWMPLVMQWRDVSQSVAATHMAIGTDVNFGQLTRVMIDHLVSEGALDLYLEHEAVWLDRDGSWRRVQFDTPGGQVSVHAGFVFAGTGGGSFELMEDSKIRERRGYGGFPVSGQWLVCTNPDIITQHAAKVYGKAALWAPPMSVPHLDTRMVDGERKLLFWPFAGFTTQFLKHGSWWDLPLSFAWHNIKSMIGAWIYNIPLTRYLIEQVLQNPKDRLAALREYMPSAQMQDRELQEAGYRVQIIKPDPSKWWRLQFGTDVVVSEDKSFATLLWASPGASVSVDIMLRIVEQCWPQYHNKISKIIPSYGQKLSDDPVLLGQVRATSQEVLQLW